MNLVSILNKSNLDDIVGDHLQRIPQALTLAAPDRQGVTDINLTILPSNLLVLSYKYSARRDAKTHKSNRINNKSNIPSFCISQGQITHKVNRI